MSAVKTIGIIGGGQLGLMIIEQAHLLGARTIIPIEIGRAHV